MIYIIICLDFDLCQSKSSKIHWKRSAYMLLFLWYNMATIKIYVNLEQKLCLLMVYFPTVFSNIVFGVK